MSAHLSEIVKVMVSPDGKYIFSAGKDQCILVCQVKELAAGNLRSCYVEAKKFN